ncbi:MAG TPA: AAA family ATPase [Terriglobales bacterium]|nr:AAA family ATPase [Terriglobales bacterium]
MRIDWVTIRDFKNLREFHVDFDESQLTTVLIGRNGSGKSNLLEALVLIFRDLDLEEMPSFAYEIQYLCRKRRVLISADPKRPKDRVRVTLDGEPLPFRRFLDRKRELLPNYVFAYYSGPANRLEKHFDQHQNLFYKALLDGESQPLRPLFYARPIHSQFVLLAYFSFPSKTSTDFLKQKFGIAGLDSILFVLREPYWARNRESRPDGNPLFWGARGVVSRFLDALFDGCLAPTSRKVRVAQSYRGQSQEEEHQYLFLPNVASLQKLAKQYGNNLDFFKNLESTYISELIHEVRIRVRKENVDGSITFRELSEGEQQLLAVRGLLSFTYDEESLFLMDEPDTHLNPAWKYEYLDILEDVVGSQQTSHLIIATHDPLLIGGLPRSQVQMFETKAGAVSARPPEEDPRGMGIDGLLRSELFGLASTLDVHTQEKFDRRRELFAKKHRTKKEDKELRQLSDELAELGISRTIRDPLYDKFVRAYSRRTVSKKRQLTSEDLQTQNKIAEEVLDEILAKESH